MTANKDIGLELWLSDELEPGSEMQISVNLYEDGLDMEIMSLTYEEAQEFLSRFNPIFERMEELR